MQPLSEQEIRASFVNATKGEVKRLRLPVDLDATDWQQRDYYGWIDPRAPLQAYLVAATPDGPVGVQLRRNTSGGGARARMCSLCLTTHSGTGVSLMVAPRAGQSGRDGNSTGIDICTDLACSLYIRNLKRPSATAPARETLSLEDKIERLGTNLAAFVRRVQAG